MTLELRSVHRSLDLLREEGVAVRCGEVARRLLHLACAPQMPVARRLLAAALGCPAERIPERFGPDELRAARHGLLGPGEPAGRCLTTASFVVVDLETTGVSTERCAILEIGAVRVEGLRLGDRFETLVDPGAPVPRRITRLTGIDARMLEDAPRPEQALPAFRRWLDRAPGAAFVAHNAGFDERFVRRALADHDLPGLAVPVLCTRRLGRRLVPALRRYDLDSLSAHFGISNPARHRALGDADATARLLLDLLALARRRGLATLGDLLDLQVRAPGRVPARASA